MRSGALKVTRLYPGRGAMRSGALKVSKLYPGRDAMRSGALKVHKLTVPWERCHEEWSTKGK